MGSLRKKLDYPEYIHAYEVTKSQKDYTCEHCYTTIPKGSPYIRVAESPNASNNYQYQNFQFCSIDGFRSHYHI